MIDIVRLFAVSYAIVQDLLPLKVLTKNKYLSQARKLAALLLTIILLSVIFLFLLPFALFRLCLGVALKVLYGKLYGGFLDGLDCLFEMKSNKIVINVILIYSSKDKLPVILEKLKDCILEIHNCSFKFSSKIKNVLGYCFFVKNQVKFEDVYDIITYNHDEYMNREMLFDYMNKNCWTINKDQMWNVTIFSQPIVWNKSRYKNGMKQYAVIYALRHSLGDGPCLVATFQKYAIKYIPQNLNAKTDVKLQKKSVGFNLDNLYIRRNPLTTKLDGTSLKIDDNTSWYIASFFEEMPKYVSIIKKIKGQMNVSFTEVISAAATASVNEYVKQRNAKLNNFTLATIHRLNIDDLLKLQDGFYKFDEMKNHFGCTALNMPFNLEERNMKNIIDYLHQYNESIRCAVDPIVAYLFLSSICVYLPIKLTRFWCSSFMTNMTTGLTNMIGFQKSASRGNIIDELFFFIPELLDTGFIFNIFSYDDRLQIVLTSRKGFVHRQEDLQEIVDNTLKYIENAEYEILKTTT